MPKCEHNQDYEKVQRQVNAAVARTRRFRTRANAVLAAAEQRLKRLSGAANDNASQTGCPV